jgi:hypothetical protein
MSEQLRKHIRNMYGLNTPPVEEENEAIAAFVYLVTSKFMKIRICNDPALAFGAEAA